MITTVRMDVKVRDRLKKFGMKGETYEEILMKLMDFKEAKNNKK